MEHRELLWIALLNAESFNDRVRQRVLLEELIKTLQTDEIVDMDSFSLLVEDKITSPSISVRKAKKLVEETGVFCFIDDVLQFCEGVVVSGETITWEVLCSLIDSQEKLTDTVHAGDTDVVYDSITKAIGWSIEMTLRALESGDIEGQPAFYSCTKDGDYPIGFKVASTATSDSLTLICVGLDYLPACGKSQEEIYKCISFLLEKTLLCQCVDESWDKGGFYPLEDQPDAFHPTVDATCLAVKALCVFLVKRDALEQYTARTFSIQDKQVMDAVIDGLLFLEHMQKADGSFGIYTYENGLSGQSNENCTRIALSTTGVCKGSGIFDRLERFELYPKCSGIIERAYHYLAAHTAKSEEGALWTPYYGTEVQDYRIEDILVSSSRVCSAWIPVWWQMEEERPNLLGSCTCLANFWEHHYEQAGGIGYYRFTTPTENGFSSGEYFWASHPHMLTAFTVLQAYNLFGLALTKKQWGLVERTVQDTLNMQHKGHGHWDNPLAKNTPFCAVTLAAIELLMEYRKAKGWSE